MDIDTENAVTKIAELAEEACDFDVVKIELEDMPGLPKTFPIGFDHRRNIIEGNMPIGGLQDLRGLAEKWRIYPSRRAGIAHVQTLTAFIDLTNRHKSEHSVIFAQTNWPKPSLTAVIDYHEKNGGKPAFCDHRIAYDFPLTDEFKAWADQDGVGMSQGEFAAFIEERVAELAQANSDEEKSLSPLFGAKIATPADMLALSRGLEIHVAGTVKQTIRLASGEGEIVFTEEHLDASGDKVVVPGLFMVSVPAFLDSDPVRLPARLRYRASNGKIVWHYQLYRWKELLRERVLADFAGAETQTGLPGFEGSPEH